MILQKMKIFIIINVQTVVLLHNFVETLMHIFQDYLMNRKFKRTAIYCVLV